MRKHFTRFVAMALLVVFSFTITGCGPSRELQHLQNQYAALQAAPVEANFTYQVTNPFVLMGKPINTAGDLQKALQNRPTVVIAIVDKTFAYADHLLRSDMELAGYAYLGQQPKGKGRLEITFKENSAQLMQQANAERDRQLRSKEHEIRQKESNEQSAMQTLLTVGGLALTAGATVLGILLTD